MRRAGDRDRQRNAPVGDHRMPRQPEQCLRANLHRRSARRRIIDRVMAPRGRHEVGGGEAIDQPPPVVSQSPGNRLLQSVGRNIRQPPSILDQRRQPLVDRVDQRGVADIGDRPMRRRERRALAQASSPIAPRQQPDPMRAHPLDQRCRNRRAIGLGIGPARQPDRAQPAASRWGHAPRRRIERALVENRDAIGEQRQHLILGNRRRRQDSRSRSSPRHLGDRQPLRRGQG